MLRDSGSGTPADEREGSFPRPFGHYLLLQPLDRGGMGEVYLAKHGKVDGIEKFCVVKTLRRAFTDDDEYVRRFIDEARVVVHLGHRNICHVFDVGKVGERYYLAMELIAGRDLRRVGAAALAANRPIPVDLSLHVAVQILEALDYAHRHMHPATGKPLGLVHRDVSPQNVMVNLEGEVKLIDFGLAATNMNVVTPSDPGVVIGKLAYMAPEQLRGDPVDGKCDVYSAAIVLYELLAGARFYEGLPRGEIWDAARNGWRPPRLDELEAGLRDLLLGALACEPAARFGCDAFLESLERYRLEKQLAAGARQLRTFMRELFPAEHEATRKMLLRYAATAPAWPDDELEQSVSIARSRSEDRTLDGLSPDEATATQSIASSSSPLSPLEETAPETGRLVPALPESRLGLASLAGALTVAVAAGLWLFLSPGEAVVPAPADEPPRSFVVEAAAAEAPRETFEKAPADAATASADGEVDDAADPARRPPVVAPSAGRPSAEPSSAATATKKSEASAAEARERPAPSPVPAAAPTTKPSVVPPAEVPSPAPAPEASAAEPLSFEEKIGFLEQRCRELPCAHALSAEFRGKALAEVSVQRLQTAVDEVKRCLRECRAR